MQWNHLNDHLGVANIYIMICMMTLSATTMKQPTLR